MHLTDLSQPWSPRSKAGFPGRIAADTGKPDTRFKYSEEIIDKIAVMVDREICQKEICRRLGLTRGQLNGIKHRYGIRYKIRYKNLNRKDINIALNKEARDKAIRIANDRGMTIVGYIRGLIMRDIETQ